MFFHAIHILHEQVLPRELVVVSKVVDALMVVKVNMVVVVANPTNIRPNEVPIGVTVRFLPTILALQHIVDGVTKPCAEQHKRNPARARTLRQ